MIQGLLGGSLDYAWLGASAYAKVYLTDPNAVEIKLTKQNVDGSTGYYSIGIARADSGITDMATAKGKTFAFADPNSTSGYLVPGAELLTSSASRLKSISPKCRSRAATSRPSSAS